MVLYLCWMFELYLVPSVLITFLMVISDLLKTFGSLILQFGDLLQLSANCWSSTDGEEEHLPLSLLHVLWPQWRSRHGGGPEGLWLPGQFVLFFFLILLPSVLPSCILFSFFFSFFSSPPPSLPPPFSLPSLFPFFLVLNSPSFWGGVWNREMVHP